MGFSLLGCFLVIRLGKSSVFDKYAQQFRKGNLKVSLSSIYAIQLLTEFVENSGNSGGSFYSYELNLVLQSGERINVMDHGVKSLIEQDAIVLSRFLKVPVWNTL